MRYVAGETQEQAIAAVRRINRSGFSATLDILGEGTKAEQQALAISQAYAQLYEVIAREGLDCNISLKLTHLGLGISEPTAERNLLRVLKSARGHQNFLRIDMEDSPYTDATIRLYSRCRGQHSHLGLVLQAYLHRSADDLASLVNSPLNVRICKGIYREPANIAYHDREKIRDNFIELVQTGLMSGAYVAIATHDLYLIDSLETWIRNRGIAADRYEFQVLYGVPMKGRLENLRSAGHKVRIYVPYGKEWYPYATRRLQENPHLIGYILKNLFRKQ